jgi:hypothetical protein
MIGWFAAIRGGTPAVTEGSSRSALAEALRAIGKSAGDTVLFPSMESGDPERYAARVTRRFPVEWR